MRKEAETALWIADLYTNSFRFHVICSQCFFHCTDTKEYFRFQVSFQFSKPRLVLPTGSQCFPSAPAPKEDYRVTSHSSRPKVSSQPFPSLSFTTQPHPLQLNHSDAPSLPTPHSNHPQPPHLPLNQCLSSPPRPHLPNHPHSPHILLHPAQMPTQPEPAKQSDGDSVVAEE